MSSTTEEINSKIKEIIDSIHSKHAVIVGAITMIVLKTKYPTTSPLLPTLLVMTGTYYLMTKNNIKLE